MSIRTTSGRRVYGCRFKRARVNHRGLGPVLLAFCSLALSSCSTQKTLSNPELQDLMNRYEQQSAKLEIQRQTEQQRGIHRLEISNPGAPLLQQQVTASLDQAHIGAVIEKLQVPYVLNEVTKITGRVTAEFQQLPIVEALAAILEPAHLQASFTTNLVTISRKPQVDLSMVAGDDYVFHKRILRYADTRALEPILSMLLMDDSDSDDDDDDSDDDYDTSTESDVESGDSSSSEGTISPTKSFSYAPIHAENAILLKGPSADVKNAMEILNAIDTDNGHIMIEAMVLQFSASDLLEIGTRISGGASGSVSDASIDWASMIGETIAFTNLAGAANTRTFRAAISMLMQTDAARVVARPYMAVVSGQQAKIDVAEDRYVTTFTENSGDVTLEPVTSGVIMTITPFLLPEEQIRMDLDVSVSRFVPTLDNVALARSRSSATSMMRIGSGETLVIGGLMAEQSSNGVAGIPGLRSIPGLNLLFGERVRSDEQRRLLIYITPYIWQPGMDTPMDAKQDLEKFIENQPGFSSVE